MNERGKEGAWSDYVRKVIDFLLIKNFTYKPKGNGLLGKIYFKWMKYIVKSKYIDVFVGLISGAHQAMVYLLTVSISFIE